MNNFFWDIKSVDKKYFILIDSFDTLRWHVCCFCIKEMKVNMNH